MFTKFKVNSYTMIPVVFVLMLFLLIAILSCAIIVAGGNIYSGISEDMDMNYESCVSFSYITSKIRQNDSENQISSTKINDTNILVINNTYDDVEVSTYLYYYDGYIREFFFERGLEIEESMSLDDGDAIIESHGFDFDMINGNMIKMSFTDKDSNISNAQITLRSEFANEE